LSVHVSLFSNHEAHEHTKETLGTNPVGLFGVLRRHSETRAMKHFLLSSESLLQQLNLPCVIEVVCRNASHEVRD
jgi:hypothetical protein